MRDRLKSALGSSAQFIQADLSSKGNIHFKGDAGSRSHRSLHC